MTAPAVQVDASVKPVRLGPADAVRIAAGLLLLAAAALKAHQLATEPVVNPLAALSGRFAGYCSQLGCRWPMIALIAVEILLGVWLLSGLWRQWSRGFAAVAFLGFLALTVSKALAGAYSCDCFGAVAVNPWITAALDAAVLAALLAFQRSANPPPTQSRVIAAVAAAVLLIVSAAVPAIRFEPSRLDADGQVIGPSKSVLVHPRDWIGKPLPLTDHIAAGARINAGRWRIVLYSWTCSGCRDLISRESARRRDGQGHVPMALIELPPYAPTGSGPTLSDQFTVGRLSDRYRWFIAGGTPTVLTVQNGRVVDVRQSGDSMP